LAVVTFPPKQRKQDPVTLVVATRSYGKANRANYQAKLATVPEMIKAREASRPLQSF
jgi:hypothetical protein